MTSPVPIPRFTGIFIPAEILSRTDISPLDMLLLSWIDALFCPEKGGCFASNEYLAERLQVKENTIAKSLTKLRGLELIVDVSFNGRLRVIKAQTHKAVDQCQSKAGLDLNPTLPWIKIQPCLGLKSNPLIYRDKSLEKSIETNTSACEVSSIEKRISIGSHVALSEAEHKSLIESHGEAAIAAIIVEINDYCASTGKSYKGYAATIRNWIRNRAEKSKQKPLRRFAPSSNPERARKAIESMSETAL